MKKIVFALILVMPSLAFAQVEPINDTTATANLSGQVWGEMVHLPIFIWQSYGTQLVWLAIVIGTITAVVGVLKLFGQL